MLLIFSICINRFSSINSWKFETISVSEIGIGGYKEAMALISGSNVFERLKFESGVHRVQRVPETESVESSHKCCNSCNFTEVEDVDIDINEKDLKVDVYRSSGPGGQSVNTTDLSSKNYSLTIWYCCYSAR